MWLDDNHDRLGLLTRDACRSDVKDHRTARIAPRSGAALCAAQAIQTTEQSGVQLRVPPGGLAFVRTFAPLPCSWSPKKSPLQQTVSVVRPQT